MTGKRYYITALADWQRYASRFSNSHWLALTPALPEATEPVPAPGEAAGGPFNPSDVNAPIVVLVEADEGAHLALEDDPAFEPLPHPFTQKPISETAREALTGLGVSPGATTFEVAETLAQFNPLLRHRVF